MNDLFEKYTDFVWSKVSLPTVEEPEMAAALGLAGEAGEVADEVKKWKFHDHPLYGEWLLEELGDVLFYFALMASARGFTLKQIIEANSAKLDARYPEGFDSDRSINR